MKPLFSALLILSLLPALPAQEVPLGPIVGTADEVRLTRDELKELTGPIALYPDPLVALILPASTFPSDIVLAARFVESGADPALADQKPWDESIRGLTRYPDVLTWMDQNLEWTTQLGYAYLSRPSDVMDAIQELRDQAHALGNLEDTPQQRIVREETYIRIVPAEPEYIYVPYYDPAIVYYERPIHRPWITFGSAWLTGYWLTFDFDWHHHRLYCGDWYGGWDYHHHRDRYRRDHYGDTIFINNNITNYQVWQGDSHRRLGSTRVFAENRSSLRDRNFARPEPLTAARTERFEGVRQAVASDKERVAWKEGKRVERDRVRPADSPTSRERGPDGRISDRERSGADGKMSDRDRVRPDEPPTSRERGPDGNVVDRSKTGEDSQSRDRGKMDSDRTPGDRGKGGVAVPRTTPPAITGDGKSDRGRNDVTAKGGERTGDTARPDLRGRPSDRPERGDGKDIPRATTPAPSITEGDRRSGKGGPPGSSARSDDKGKGPSPQSRVDAIKPSSPAPTIREDGRRSGKGGPPGSSARIDDTGKGAPPRALPAPSAIRPSSPAPSRPSVEERKPSAPSNVTPRPSPSLAPPQARPAPSRSSVQERKPSAVTPRPSPSVAPPQARPAPSVSKPPGPSSSASERKSPPKPKVSSAPIQRSAPSPPPTVRKSSPQQKPSTPTVRKAPSPPKPSAPVVRKAPSPSKPSAPAVRKAPSPSKPVASAPRKSAPKPAASKPAAAKPQAKPSGGGEGKKPSSDDKRKKK